jgi:hypothetical protein
LFSHLILATAHGCHDQAHEKPPEGEHEDNEALFTPLPVLLEFMEENADNNKSVFLCPHSGQSA